ncbi:MAG TPA: FHA domain-containing protein, partial [Myxococcaceae bacterium]|nr:FHA domain-containing protein [Myxococcaceae bacterium]
VPSMIDALRPLAPAQPLPLARSAKSHPPTLPKVEAPFPKPPPQDGLSVGELRAFTQTLTPDEFVAQLGPFALIQRLQDPALAARAQRLAASSTGGKIASGHSQQMFVQLMMEFEHLRVVILPPLRRMDALSVGRLPDNDLVIDDPSVSKRHALLSWDGSQRRCRVQDLGSLNGTSLNGVMLRSREAPLNDGDLLVFGDTGYLYMLSETLHARLARKVY